MVHDSLGWIVERRKKCHSTKDDEKHEAARKRHWAAILPRYNPSRITVDAAGAASSISGDGRAARHGSLELLGWAVQVLEGQCGERPEDDDPWTVQHATMVSLDCYVVELGRNGCGRARIGCREGRRGGCGSPCSYNPPGPRSHVQDRDTHLADTPCRPRFPLVP